MYVPDAQIVGEFPTQPEAVLFLSRITLLLVVPSYTLLLITLLFFYFKTIHKNKSAFHPLVKQVTLLAITSNIYLLLNSILGSLFQFPLSLINIPRILLFFVFPVMFVTYLAWKSSIALYLRYLIIVSYFILLIAGMITSIPWFMEQIVFNRRFCFGFTCPVTTYPVIIIPENYQYLKDE